MKSFLKYILFFVLLMTLVLSFAACGDEPPEETPEEPDTDGPGTEPGTDPEPLTEVVIFQNGKDPNKYSIIYPKGDQASLDAAVKVGRIFRTVTGILPNPKADEDTPVGEYEILIGKTNRPVSQTLVAEVDAIGEENKWGFRIGGSSLAIYAAGSLAWDRCCTYLQDTLIVNKKDLILSTTFAYTGCITATELEEIRRQEAEALASAIAAIVDKINAMPLSDFYGCSKEYTWEAVKDEVASTGTYVKTPDTFAVVDMSEALAAQSYSAPSRINSPKVGQHPRLLFTEADIPGIKAAMESSLCTPALENVKRYKDEDVDGILPALIYKDPKILVEEGHTEYSNYDEKVLEKIQAKAFWYAVTGEKIYGYQAIYAMFNYLRTLDIGYRKTDQCRNYGYTAYMAALVYDWCYDLLTVDMREKMVLGIQNTCYIGYSSLPDGHLGNGKKTEVGFPPTKGSGPIEGHGCEREILCDALAVSIAIYDEYPSWYELVGARVFSQYMPARNYFYESAGMYPCGTAGYAEYRYSADIFSAWLLSAALGKNPYSSEMQQVARSMAAHVFTPGGDLFATGDGPVRNASFCWNIAAISSLVFNDPYMRNFSKGIFEEGGNFEGDQVAPGILTATELVLCGMKGTEMKDYRECLDVVTYNGGYYQQIIARKNFSDSSPIVMLRGATSTNIDHSHRSSGEFQIYYKGLLSCGDGEYCGYGTDHHYYYHQATIAHSCMLVYNPDRQGMDKGYYSGSQTFLEQSKDYGEYQFFIDGAYSTGKVTGVKYGYDGAGDAKYVYYANDLTKAYSVNVVDYVARSIVTTFPQGVYPMVMFVYDRVDVPETDYTKTFLLQCVKAPVLDTTNLTATVDNGTGGRMVLKNLYGGADIAAYGADREDDPQRYWISTQNKNLPTGGTSRKLTAWGKVEVRTPAGNRSDVMVNVVYVTDSTNNTMLETELLTGTGYYGAKAAGQTAIFAFGEDGTSYAENTLTFTATGTGTQDYYIGGLTAGTWNVMLGSQNIGNMTVAAGENVLVFSAEGTGTVTVAPVNLTK